MGCFIAVDIGINTGTDTKAHRNCHFITDINITYFIKDRETARFKFFQIKVLEYDKVFILFYLFKQCLIVLEILVYLSVYKSAEQ